MRTAVACFVLAAAIATPGIVLAATSSAGNSVVLVPDVVTATRAVQPGAPPPTVDPLLRPSVDAVRGALERRGGEPVHVFPAGAGMAQLLQLPVPGHRCPTTVNFELGQPPASTIIVTGGPRCDSGSTDHGNVHITYSPKSLAPTVKQALATLPR